MATIEIRQLEAFAAVVHEGSFTAAAERLATQKAHVSRLVSGLEDRLGVRLLQRSTRSLTLTEVGREFFARAEGVLQALDETERAVRDTQGEPRGTLKLTCGTEIGLMIVNRWIEHYLVRYPRMRIDVEYTTRIVDIIHEGFDLAIRLGALQDSGLSARKLGEISYGLYASPAYLARRGTPQEPAEIERHDLIAFATTGDPFWTLFHRGEPAAGPPRTYTIIQRPRFAVNNNIATRDAALHGLGIGIMGTFTGDPLGDSGELVRVLPAWSYGPVAIHAVFASSKYLAPKVRAFIDLAAESLGQ